jgi:hypothetical protein
VLSVGQTTHIGQYTLRDHLNITNEQMIVTNQPVVVINHFNQPTKKHHSLLQRSFDIHDILCGFTRTQPIFTP